MPGLNSVDGISSGLDTTNIVDTIIQSERIPALLLESQQAEKQSIITAYQALQAKFFGLSSTLAKLTKTATFEQASIDVSDETILTAAAKGRVGSGSYNIQVLSLARNHQLASQGFSDESLSSFGTGTINIKIGDGVENSITIDSSNNSLVGIKKAINDANVGVTASIINDGSSSQPYRLILSANKTGAANKMTVTSNLTGGNNLNYSSVSFDSPESVMTAASTTSRLSLGTTAAYTGSENKIYTFTVAGTGSQTIGTDNIVLNWSDGANTGSIVVTQADTEVELVGDGADGLNMMFSTGTLNAGDTFQVSTFAPLLQEASDARITLGSTGGTGSPITVTSTTNTFNDVVSGLSLSLLKETDVGETVTINTALDTEAIKSDISTFIDQYNSVMDYIDKQNTYDQENDEAGILFGDFTVWSMQNSVRTALGSRIAGLEGNFNQLYAIGIRTNADGKLTIADSSRLNEALENNLEDVIKMFTRSGSSSSNFIEFVSSTSSTRVGEEFEVDITQAATHGRYQGSGISDPSASPITLNNLNNRLKISVDGVTSNELVLTEKTYQSYEELVQEIQARIDNDEKIGSRGLTVEWVSSGTNVGYLNFESSTYGATSKVTMVTSIANTALTTLGLATGGAHAGLDVKGTINGEEAEGKGQYLTGKEDNATTEGLKIKVTFDDSHVSTGVEGSITLTRGVAARVGDMVDSLTKSGDGTFDRRIKSYQNQIDEMQNRIDDIDERLAARRESLYEQYYAMETLLGQLNSESDYLTSQLAGISANWKTSGGN